MTASLVRIQLAEMFKMYLFILDSATKENPNPYAGILDYIRTSMAGMAEVSHGDVVLERRGKALRREKANYQEQLKYSYKENQKKK